MTSASVPLLDDTIAFGEEETNIANKDALKHPFVTIWHILFRGAAIVTYMVCGLFSNSFITSFVVIVLLLSMDFWTVKNITGRFMVGLRWWNYVASDGQSHWVFESRKDQEQNRTNEREARIFWTALILAPLLWSLFFIISLFSFDFKWMLLVIIALILNGANLYGYIKCKVGQSQSLSAVTSDFFRTQVLQGAVSMVSKQAMTPNSNPMSPPTNTV